MTISSRNQSMVGLCPTEL